MKKEFYLMDLLKGNPVVIVVHNLTLPEKEYLIALLKVMQVHQIFYQDNFKASALSKGDVLIIDIIYDDVLQDLMEWSLKIQVIGRLSDHQKKILLHLGILNYWDLDQFSIIDLSRIFLKSFMPTYPVSAYIWSDSTGFNKKLQSIFQSYSISFIGSNNPDFAIFSLEENDYDLLILDWDKNGGYETSQIIKELRKVKDKKKRFPFVIGIKDFSKDNLFSDLSSGVKEFCSILFSYNEVLELMIRSLPFSFLKGSYTYKPPQELPFLKYNYNSSNKTITFDYTKESLLDEENENALQYELDKALFSKQFQWVSNLLDKD